MQGFALIPYRRQTADFIHGYRRDFMASCNFVLRVQKKPNAIALGFFYDVFRKRNVMYPSEVKYASRVKCAFGT